MLTFCVPLLYFGPVVAVPVVIDPAGVAAKLKAMPPEVRGEVTWSVAACAAATLLATTLMYTPRLSTWTRCEQVVEVTNDSIIVVRIDPWRRYRREVPLALVQHVTCFGGSVVAVAGEKRFGLLRCLARAEAARLARTLNEALGLPVTMERAKSRGR